MVFLKYESLFILYGSNKYKVNVNKEILPHTINFIKNTKRFEIPLFHH